MENITVYSASELKEQFPNGFERAHAKYCDTVSQEPLNWQPEIMHSLKAMFKQADIKLLDWSISDSSPSNVKFEIPTYYSELASVDMLVDDYTGKRAVNWVKDAYGIKTIKRINYTYVNEHGRKVKAFRYEITKKDGTDWSCELTGVCYDHDFMDSLLDDIKGRCTLSEAYHNLADKAGQLFYAEWESQQTEEYFIDHADANDYQFTEEGVQI